MGVVVVVWGGGKGYRALCLEFEDGPFWRWPGDEGGGGREEEVWLGE